MKITTLGRKITLRQSFINKVETKLRKLDRYFEDDATATVTASHEKDRFTAEITVKNRGILYRAERTAPSLDEAFGAAADQIVRQIVKNKEKLGTRIKRGAPEPDYFVPKDDYEVEGGEPHIVREKTFALEAMTPDDAALQMEMLDHSFFVFKDLESTSVNVVYRREDGNYGLLKPLY